MNVRAELVIGVPSLVGVVSGAVGTGLMAGLGGVQVPGLVVIMVLSGAFLGFLGAALSGVLAWVAVLRRPWGEHTLIENMVLALRASLSAGVIVMIVFFFRQGDQPPAVLVGLPALLIAATLLLILKGSRPGRPVPRVQPRMLSLAVLGGLVGVALVSRILFEMVPPALRAEFAWSSLLQASGEFEEEIVARAIGAVVIALGSACAVAVGVALTDLRGRVAVLAALTAPLAVALTHLTWLASPVISALFRLGATESPPTVIPDVLQALGWAILVAWLVVAWRRQGATDLSAQQVGYQDENRARVDEVRGDDRSDEALAQLAEDEATLPSEGGHCDMARERKWPVAWITSIAFVLGTGVSVTIALTGANFELDPSGIWLGLTLGLTVLWSAGTLLGGAVALVLFQRYSQSPTPGLWPAFSCAVTGILGTVLLFMLIGGAALGPAGIAFSQIPALSLGVAALVMRLVGIGMRRTRRQQPTAR